MGANSGYGYLGPMEMLKASGNRFEKIALAKLGDDMQLLVERIKILSTCIPKGILVASLVLMMSGPSLAQSDQGSLPGGYSCNSYARFLGLMDFQNIAQCSELEELVISSQGISDADFFQIITTNYGDTNAIGLLSNALRSASNEDWVSAFRYLDASDRLFYSAMMGGGDENRATVYAIFFSSAKAELLQRICGLGGAEESCPEFQGFFSVDEILGSGYPFLDTAHPFSVLTCLVRNDALTAHITEVISSRRFGVCLVERKFEF